jgi:hypothetical protein
MQNLWQTAGGTTLDRAFLFGALPRFRPSGKIRRGELFTLTS